MHAYIQYYYLRYLNWKHRIWYWYFDRVHSRIPALNPTTITFVTMDIEIIYTYIHTVHALNMI